MGQHVGQARGRKGSHGLDAGAVLVPSANVAMAWGGVWVVSVPLL